MAPPHLHPRSRMTSSLFATAVFASFFVVTLPHFLPCPAPRVALADGQIADPQQQQQQQQLQQRRRRRRQQLQDEALQKEQQLSLGLASAVASDVVPDVASDAGAAEVQRAADGTARFSMVDTDGAATVRAPRTPRECPIPKPGRILGSLLGITGNTCHYQQQQQEELQQQRPPLPTPLDK